MRLLVSIIHGKYVCTPKMQRMGALLILSSSWSGIISTWQESDLVEGVPPVSGRLELDDFPTQTNL